MSCTADQLSQDSGVGKGSVWTNHFIANGDMTPGYTYEFKGYTFSSKDGKGNK